MNRRLRFIFMTSRRLICRLDWAGCIATERNPTLDSRYCVFASSLRFKRSLSFLARKKRFVSGARKLASLEENYRTLWQLRESSQWIYLSWKVVSEVGAMCSQNPFNLPDPLWLLYYNIPVNDMSIGKNLDLFRFLLTQKEKGPDRSTDSKR